jgi:cytoskeletal protein RodZ
VDELDLLHESDGPGGPKRPPWVLVGGLLVVVLLALVGVGWMVGTVAGRDGKVTTAAPASTTPAATTAAATTEPAQASESPSESAFPTALPSSSPTPRRTISVPVGTVAPSPTPRVTTPAPKPSPKPTTTPAGLVEVPDVVGLKVKSATAILQAAGFRVSVLGGILQPDRDQRRVTVQRPAAGTKARAGAVVILLTDGL